MKKTVSIEYDPSSAEGVLIEQSINNVGATLNVLERIKNGTYKEMFFAELSYAIKDAKSTATLDNVFSGLYGTQVNKPVLEVALFRVLKMIKEELTTVVKVEYSTKPPINMTE